MALTKKAGMNEVDINDINEFIRASTKGSRFAQAQERREANLKIKIEELLSKLSALPATPESISESERLANAITEPLQLLRDDTSSRAFIHVDMDSFYVSVETMDNSSLKNKPIAVGSLDMLQTSSYEARKFGIRAGMPGFLACQLCPQLEIIQPRPKRYKEISLIIHSILSKYDPHFKPTCLDEASLCVSQPKQQQSQLKQNICSIASNIGKLISSEINSMFNGSLSCSIGISHTPQLAKMCAQLRKPGGTFILPFTKEAAIDFLSRSQLSKTGIGHVNSSLLSSLGIFNCGQLISASSVIVQLFSKKTSKHFFALALGVDGLSKRIKTEEMIINSNNSLPTTTTTSFVFSQKRSISRERTIKDFYDSSELEKLLEELCKSTADELEILPIESSNEVTLKIRDIDFEKHEFQCSSSDSASKVCVHNFSEIYQIAQEIWGKALKELGGSDSIRTIGIRLSSLKYRAPQTSV